jgi:hypothetical protein
MSETKTVNCGYLELWIIGDKITIHNTSGSNDDYIEMTLDEAKALPMALKELLGDTL